METDPPGPPLSKKCDFASVRDNVRQLVKDEGLTLKDAVSASLDYAKKQGCDISKIRRAANKIKVKR